MQAEAKERRKVTVAFPTEKNSPLYKFDENGRPSGMMGEYFETLERCTGWEIEYVIDDMDVLYTKFLDGEIDIMGTMAWTQEMEEFVDYPVIASGTDHTSLAALGEEEDIVMGDASTVNGKTVAVTTRQQKSGKVEELEQFCAKSGISVKTKVYEDNDEYLNSLRNKEADLLMIGSMAKPSDMWEVLYFNDQPYYTTVSKGKPDILNELNMALYTMHRVSYDYSEALYQKYFSNNVSGVGYTFTQEEKEYIHNKKVLKAAIQSENSSEKHTGGNQGNTGFMADVAEYFTKTIGFDIEYVYADGEEGVKKALESGKADFAPVIIDRQSTSSEEKGALISYADIEQVMVTNLSSSDKTKTLAVVESQYDSKKSNDEDIESDGEVLLCKTQEECLDSVASGKADMTYMDMFTAQYYIVQKGYSNLSVLLLGTNSGTLNIKISDRADAELITIFEKVRMYMQDDQITQVLLQNVVNQKTQISVIDFIKQHMAVTFTTIFICICVVMGSVFWAIYSRVMRKNAEEAVKEREENEMKLGIALKKANAATEAKSRFLSNISHEMRTPLNGITGMLALMDTENMTGKGKVQLHQAQTAAEHLMTLISDVLDIARIESGEEKLKKEPFEMSRVLEQTEEILLMEAQEKHISLYIKNESPKEVLLGDAPKVRQMLLNIVGNSIKFLQEEGRAEVIVKRGSESDGNLVWYEFICKDNGPGISDEFRKDMFKVFTREQMAEQQQIRGTGLGLSIVKGIVDLHGGEISVDGEKGEGTEFHIKLPFEKAPEDVKVNTEDTESDRNNLYDMFEDKRVLVAEDNELNREIMVEFLNMMGMECRTAQNGMEAVDEYLSRPEGYYDIIFMDIQMPECDGYHASKLIRESGRRDARTIPIIAATANAFLEDIEKAEDAGMNGHLAKPINIGMLKDILKKHIV